jgi:PAS domain-containing protein
MAARLQLERIIAISWAAAAVLAATAGGALLALIVVLTAGPGSGGRGIAGMTALAVMAAAGAAGAAAAVAAARAVAAAARERHQVETALHDSEERFRALAEGSVDAVMTFDAAGRIVFANPAAERLLGYSEAELLGRDSAVLLPEFLRRVHREEAKRCRWRRASSSRGAARSASSPPSPAT